MSMNQAVDKLRDEMAASSGNASVQRIGDYLTDYLRRHPGAAAAIGAEGKDIKGALKALEDYARKQPRSGNCAMVDDETAFGVVLGYYGIDGQKPAPAKARGGALDLDELLKL